MRAYAIAPFVLQSVLRLPVLVLFKVLCRFEVRGAEKLYAVRRPVIIAPNHVHRFLDVIAINLALPWPRFHPLMYVDGGKTFYDDDRILRLLFPLFRLLGGISLHRNTGDYERGLASHIDVVNDGMSDCIFPEGQCSKDGRLRRGRGGVAYLGAHTNTLVIPACIEGTWRISLMDILLRRRRISVTFGDPIQFSAQENGSRVRASGYYQHAADLLMERIAALQNDVFS